MASEDPGRRIKVLFQQALQKPTTDRNAWIVEVSGDDHLLRGELEAMLATHYREHAGRPALPVNRHVGPYEIVSEIGRGGMGVVYKAKDPRLNRHVALKLLPVHAVADEQSRLRFTNEAKAAAALDHPNVCTVYDLHEHEGGTAIAMAFLEGEGLDRKISRGPVEIREAVGIGEQIARGLQAAHKKGVVHRDVKPGNVIITVDGTVKLVDFGLALLASESRLTLHGMTVGTTAYMAPEQAMGEEVDHRADIWAWGVVFYEMVSGKIPFSGLYQDAIVYSILNEAAEPLTSLRSDVGIELERIADKAMEKDRRNRYQHVDDLLVDLRRARTATGRGSASRSRETGSGTRFAETLSESRVGVGWWRFHQAAVISFCAVLTAAIYAVSYNVPIAVTRTAFLVGVGLACLIGILRLHLLFTSWLNPRAMWRELDRVTPWALRADWCMSATVLATALAVAAERRLIAGLLMGAAAAYAAVFLLVEPATRAAVFHDEDFETAEREATRVKLKDDSTLQ
jgi:tRNA A-37 threonylcarbamoyl transferase component Bud32